MKKILAIAILIAIGAGFASAQNFGADRTPPEVGSIVDLTKGDDTGKKDDVVTPPPADQEIKQPADVTPAEPEPESTQTLRKGSRMDEVTVDDLAKVAQASKLKRQISKTERRVVQLRNADDPRVKALQTELGQLKKKLSTLMKDKAFVAALEKLINDSVAKKGFIGKDDENYQKLAKLLARENEDSFTVEDLFDKEKEGNIFTLSGQVNDIAKELGYEPENGKLTVIDNLKKAYAEIQGSVQLSTILSVVAIIIGIVSIFISLARRTSAPKSTAGKPSGKPMGKRVWDSDPKAAETNLTNLWNAFKVSDPVNAGQVQVKDSRAINAFWNYVGTQYVITAKDIDNVMLEKVVKANPI